MAETKRAMSVQSSTEMTRFNAMRHGLLSRYTVLPWENGEEYHMLLAALVAEHGPKGPTEEHLVEELAGIVWRKRRLRLAESAASQRGLKNAISSYSHDNLLYEPSSRMVMERAKRAREAIYGIQEDTVSAIADIEKREELVQRAVELVESNREDAYDAALAVLDEGVRETWNGALQEGLGEVDESEPYTADAHGLMLFLRFWIQSALASNRTALIERPELFERLTGDALDLGKMEQLSRYEVHLDRKLDRTLSMLLNLQSLRPGAGAG